MTYVYQEASPNRAYVAEFGSLEKAIAHGSLRMGFFARYATVEKPNGRQYIHVEWIRDGRSVASITSVRED